MERELTLATLSLSACGSALLAVGVLPSARRITSRGGHALERFCHRQLWTPLVVALVAFAILIGWSLQEPDMTGEALSPIVTSFALVVAALWARALLRAVLSLRASIKFTGATARTVGLLRPKVFIEEALAGLLDPAEVRAVLEHEQAHVRHRDPLRILLAQLVTDLQWPMPLARARLRAWRHALELARDEEARAQGVDGADLASAVLKAERLRVEQRSAAVAALVDGPHLVDRIARLLDPVESSTRRHVRWMPGAVGLLLVFAVAAGTLFGEPLLRRIGGVHGHRRTAAPPAQGALTH